MSQFVIGNADSDGSTFSVPGDQPGSPDSIEIDDAQHQDVHEWYIHVDNGWGVGVDATVRGTHYQDSAMNNPADDGSAVTVNSGSADFFDGTTGHSFIELQIAPAADPTSGNLTVTFQTREA